MWVDRRLEELCRAGWREGGGHRLPAAPPLSGVPCLACRARQTAERLEATQAAYDALCAEHAALQDRRRHEEAESYEATAALRRELTSKAAQLAAAQAEVTTSAQQLQEAQAAAAAREAALQTEFASERAAAAQVVAELQARLDALADFQAQRDSMLNEMQRLRTDNAYIAQEAGDKVTRRGGSLFGFVGQQASGVECCRRGCPTTQLTASHPPSPITNPPTGAGTAVPAERAGACGRRGRLGSWS